MSQINWTDIWARAPKCGAKLWIETPLNHWLSYQRYIYVVLKLDLSWMSVSVQNRLALKTLHFLLRQAAGSGRNWSLVLRRTVFRHVHVWDTGIGHWPSFLKEKIALGPSDYASCLHLGFVLWWFIKDWYRDLTCSDTVSPWSETKYFYSED